MIIIIFIIMQHLTHHVSVIRMTNRRHALVCYSIVKYCAASYINSLYVVFVHDHKHSAVLQQRQPFYGHCVSWHTQLVVKGFCQSKVLLPACPC